jgi:hypothetical protein
MKALISFSRRATGATEVRYLGSGADESAARRAAFEFVNRGRNPCDNEFPGGVPMDCTPRLAAALSEGARGGDAFITFGWATGSLYVTPAGLLDAAFYSREEWDSVHG